MFQYQRLTSIVLRSKTENSVTFYSDDSQQTTMKEYILISLIFIASSCKSPSHITETTKIAGSGSEKTLSSSIQKAGVITVSGLTFNYVEQGSGQPVVLVHGSVSDYREWSKQVAALSQYYHVIAYSRRYHWPNFPPGPDADASLEKQVDDLAGIITALGLGPVHIIGHSYGGAVALHLTLRRPDLVQTLVLAEPAVASVLSNTPENDSALKEAQIIRAKMKEIFASGNAELIVKTYADHVAPGRFEKSTPEERKMLLENVSAFQLDYTSQRPPFTCNDAQKIRVPVLVISGNLSPMGLQLIAETTTQCIKGSRRVKIPEATHWMVNEQEKVFSDAVLEFLNKNKK
jgi:pimeloyl-ACP methyl ester carboxylesterase